MIFNRSLCFVPFVFFVAKTNNERKAMMKKMMMAVSFNENGIMTNQCETVRTECDAL